MCKFVLHNALCFTTPCTKRDEASTTSLPLVQKGKMEKIRLMEKLQREELNLYIAKSHDYGSGPVDETGLVGLLVRILDKVHRALYLSENGRVARVKDENLRDTLMDISNYANMAIIELETP